MTTLQVDSPYWQSALWLCSSGIGSGMFNSPEHRRDDGRRPGRPPRDRRRRADDAAEHRRGALDRVRAGDRHRRGAEGRAVQDLLRRGDAGCRDAQLEPVHPQHAHGAVGAGGDLAGRRRRVAACARAQREREPVRRWPHATPLRIGEVAERVGTTPRTIRYYEEIGLLPEPRRPRGRHATASTASATSSGCASCCGCKRAARRHASTSSSELLEAEEARAALRERVAAQPTTRRRAAPRDPRARRSATSTASSRSCAAAATSSTALEAELADEARERVARKLREL